MQQYKNAVSIRASQDSSHYGSYQIELEAEIPGSMESAKKALKSCGLLACDFDQWGMSFLSHNDPNLTADVDELGDYGDNSRLILRKGKLAEYDINNTREYLRQTYREITDEISVLPTEFVL